MKRQRKQKTGEKKFLIVNKKQKESQYGWRSVMTGRSILRLDQKVMQNPDPGGFHEMLVFILT